MIESFAGLKIRNSGQLFDENVKLSVLCYADPKYGKTRFGATLNDLTLKTVDKPTLYIMCEAGEGGGAGSIQDQNVPCVFPQTREELDKILALLASDTQFGGVVLDSATEVVNRLIKPWMLKNTQSKEANNAIIKQARNEGVPARDDYNKILECMRDWLNRLINLSTPKKKVKGPNGEDILVPDLDRAKHIYVTAHKRTKTDKDGEIACVGPDLPGQLLQNACGLFQTVGTIDRFRIKENGTSVVKEIFKIEHPTQPYILGDRLNLIADGSPLDFTQIYEQQILPKIGK